MGPGLEREIGLGVDNDEEGGNVAREFAILPLPRLPRGRRRRPVEEITLGALLRPGARPPPLVCAAALSRPRSMPAAHAIGFDGRWARKTLSFLVTPTRTKPSFGGLYFGTESPFRCALMGHD